MLISACCNRGCSSYTVASWLSVTWGRVTDELAPVRRIPPHHGRSAADARTDRDTSDLDRRNARRARWPGDGRRHLQRQRRADGGDRPRPELGIGTRRVSVRAAALGWRRVPDLAGCARVAQRGPVAA